MKNKKPMKPQLPPLVKGDFYLENEEIFSGIEVSGGDQSYLAAKSMVLRQSKLSHFTMQKADLDRFECSNVIFDRCDFSNLEWLGGSFHQVVFHQCKLTGTNFADSYLRDCVFEECSANFSTFNHTNLKTVIFDNCQLNDSEFTELVWKDLLLHKNQLSHSSWLLTKMNGIDFKTNSFDRITLSKDQVRGLQVDQEQALVIAAALGLIID